MNAASRTFSRKKARQASRPSSSGFTLMELLLAATVSALLAAVLYGVMSSALRLRERGQEMADRNAPATAALAVLRRDLSGMTATTGTFQGPILGEPGAATNSQADTLSFYTTTGIVDDTAPWGDIQQVTYRLADPTSKDDAGRELVRDVTRNLLPTAATDPQTQPLLDGVQSLRFQYLIAGTETWEDSWDSSADSGTTLSAVRAHIDFTAPTRHSLDLVCEITARGMQ